MDEEEVPTMITDSLIRQSRLPKRPTRRPEHPSSEVGQPVGQERAPAMLRPPTGHPGRGIPIRYEPSDAVWDCFGDPCVDHHCSRG